MSVIAERYRKVLGEIADAADLAGRDPREITTIAVSKTVGPAEIAQAVAAGIQDFGENRAHDFTAKQALFPQERWHFIGTLQSNKVKQVVGKAALIHSVDSLGLLRAIDRRAEETGVVQPVLLEVSVAGEATKHGMTYEEAEEAVRGAGELRNVLVRGLMTMAPLARPGSVRWVFKECALWRARLQSLHCDAVDLQELSMGMSNDFAVAVEEGATIVRIGRAIFGR